jgi:hypothetical protein
LHPKDVQVGFGRVGISPEPQKPGRDLNVEVRLILRVLVALLEATLRGTAEQLLLFGRQSGTAMEAEICRFTAIALAFH